MNPTAEELELLICDKLGMFSNGSTESLAEALEQLFKSSLPPAEGAEYDIKYGDYCTKCSAFIDISHTTYDEIYGRLHSGSCGGNVIRKKIDTAEGAEEILEKHISKEYLNDASNEDGGLWMKPGLIVAMQEFADKMVSERLKKEFTELHSWLLQKGKPICWHNIDLYLKSRDNESK